MLVLTRRVRESIVIDGNITITILRMENGQVRIGVDAPRELTVHRGEIQKLIDKDARK